MSAEKNRRGPGRPSGRSPAVRRKLLDAARTICIDVGFDAASIKAIAAEAGVNPAMINYYFGGKEGLTQAMMRDAMAPLAEQLDALEKAGPKAMTLEQFVRGYMRTLASNPWLPRLVVREVLPANGRFRELFMTELASRAAALLPRLLRAEREAGRLDAASDVELTMISVVSLVVFPFLAAPILEPALGLDLSKERTVDRLIAHSVDTVSAALGAPRSRRMEAGRRSTGSGGR